VTVLGKAAISASEGVLVGVEVVLGVAVGFGLGVEVWAGSGVLVGAKVNVDAGVLVEVGTGVSVGVSSVVKIADAEGSLLAMGDGASVWSEPPHAEATPTPRIRVATKAALEITTDHGG
jgi:hypothetical protein